MQRIVYFSIVMGVLAMVLLAPTAPALALVGPDALKYCRDFAYSTEEDFITKGPEPPDGNPIVSDGDLLSPECDICARNADLLKVFDIRPEHDLGLDAVHVVDPEKNLVVFSTELDSSNLSQFTAGDLLVTNGAIIPNIALMRKTGFIRPDMGLDGVQMVGKPENILTFLNFAVTVPKEEWLDPPDRLAVALQRHEIDILFSVEGTGPIPSRPVFLDGDLLSAATGAIVAANSTLLPNIVPAGIPTRGVDFGLDAVNLNPLDPENLRLTLFSTEILYRNKPAFTDGDVLEFDNGVVIPNQNLIQCFEPNVDFMGLDALFRIMTIVEMESLLALIASSEKLDLSGQEQPSGKTAFSTAGSAEDLSLQLDKCSDLAFSTEEEFVTQGPTPPDGNPIISDGDLLAPDGTICARNQDLVRSFDIDEDLGLDAVDVIRGAEPLIAFSTELDSTNNGLTAYQFTAGDLLATNYAIIPNVALTYLFNVGYDVGLDGIHFVGGGERIEDRIIGFLNEAKDLGRARFIEKPNVLIDMLRQWEIDIWFSTEGTGPLPGLPGFLDGDMLSARNGTIVASNSILLPESVPAGVPSRGVDFGLDAVAGDREGEIEMIGFSSEILFNGEPGFSDGDILLAGNGVIRTNRDLIAAFEPKADFLGLDALSMVTRKPDLVITRIRCDSQSRRIGYEVKNVGFAAAPANHYTLLLIPDPAGGMLSFHDLVPVVLNPGATHEGWFSVPDSAWPPCEYLPVTVCADSSDVATDDNLVDELNEYNNCQEGECLFAELEWTWNSTTVAPDFDQVMMAPVAADLNGDEIPDIIFFTFDRSAPSPNWVEAILRAISGDDGTELFSITNPSYRVNGGGSPAVADIDNDDRPEILATNLSGAIICFEHDGTFKWVSTGATVGRRAISVADLNEDGTPEIIAGHSVFNNAGVHQWSGSGGSSSFSAVANLDLSGHPELISGTKAYRHDGTNYWTTTPSGSAIAVANLDVDAYPEIVLVGSSEITVKEHDGTVKWGPIPVPSTGNGPPVVADIDGDGWPEIGVGGDKLYTAFETNGSIKWSVPIVDTSSRSASSSAFDFDQDGIYEIVYSDHFYLRIFRGTDGFVLFESSGPSGTLQEHPIILDVDNDGHVEIVAPLNNYAFPGNTGIEVYGNDECWPMARTIWNQHGYHVTNVKDDASIPQYEANSWEFLNHYRAQSSADVCKADFDKDGDVDGKDLFTWLGGGTGITLAEFAAEFGRTDCP